MVIVHATRGKRIYTDFCPGIVSCQVFSKTHHTSFCSGVINRLIGHTLPVFDVNALVGAVQAVGGADVDNAAFLALFEHGLDTGLRDQEHTGQVDVEGCIPLLERIIFEGAGGNTFGSRIRVELGIQGRAVDEDVEAAELLRVSEASSRVDSMRVTSRPKPAAAYPDSISPWATLSAASPIQICYNDRRTCFCKGPAKLGAKQARATRNNGYLSIEIKLILNHIRTPIPGRR